MDLVTVRSVRMPSYGADITFDPGERPVGGGTWSYSEEQPALTGLVDPTACVPALSDVPRTEVLFAETHDLLGPLGAKSMSDAPYNPVAPALANAIRDAIGIRPRRLPMTRDRVWALAETAGL